MPDKVIYLRGVPDDIHHRLVIAAASNRRSLNAEVIQRLRVSLGCAEQPHAEPQPDSGIRTAVLTKKTP